MLLYSFSQQFHWSSIILEHHLNLNFLCLPFAYKKLHLTCCESGKKKKIKSAAGHTLNFKFVIYYRHIGDNISISEDLIATIDERRKVASGKDEEEMPEISTKKKEAYIDLIMRMDEMEDEREKRIAADKSEGIDTDSMAAAAMPTVAMHDGMDVY